jgi:chromate transporter
MADSLHPGGRSEAASHGALFAAFLKIGVLGFGGVAGWVRRILVEERGWLEEREFAELLGVASVLPGANTVNLSIMVGDRFQGVTGALAALAGLMGVPLALLVAIALLYDRFAGLAPVRAALGGAAAAAAGLVVGQALKMLRNAGSDALMLGGAALTFAGVAVLRLPVALTLAVLIPASVAACLMLGRKR